MSKHGREGGIVVCLENCFCKKFITFLLRKIWNNSPLCRAQAQHKYNSWITCRFPTTNLLFFSPIIRMSTCRKIKTSFHISWVWWMNLSRLLLAVIFGYLILKSVSSDYDDILLINVVIHVFFFFKDLNFWLSSEVRQTAVFYLNSRHWSQNWKNIADNDRTWSTIQTSTSLYWKKRAFSFFHKTW